MLGKKCSCLRNMNGYQKPQQTSCRPMDEANCLYNSLPYKNKWISIELSKQMHNFKIFFVSPKSGGKMHFPNKKKTFSWMHFTECYKRRKMYSCRYTFWGNFHFIEILWILRGERLYFTYHLNNNNKKDSPKSDHKAL